MHLPLAQTSGGLILSDNQALGELPNYAICHRCGYWQETFTDCVTADDEGSVTLGKALSTPQDFSIGAIDAIRDAAKNLGLKNEGELLTFTKFFFHACTVGDNTLITRSGAKTGLITTKGFADTLLMMRGRTTDGLTRRDPHCVCIKQA